MTISFDTTIRRTGLLLAAGAVLVALQVPASSNAASPGQRVMLVQEHRVGSPTGTFELYALTQGPLRSDLGKYEYMVAERPPIVRNGQGLARYVVVATLTGRRGTLQIRSRVVFAGAGSGNTVGTGTWSVIRGTGAYAGATGSGRVALIVATSTGFTSSQAEGFVRAPARVR